ncbi:MAG: hypothetical protein E7218_05655 [Anaerofustis stercorihominis]|nr:hypothetical protein [Anaerofustis stercorihominis]
MKNIPMSPKAKKFIRENNIDIAAVTPTGTDGDIRYVKYDDAAKATPLAEKLASQNGVDLSKVGHTGEKISRNDVLKYIRMLDAKKAYRLSGAREALADNLSSSNYDTIPYTLFAKVNSDKAYEYYRNVKETTGISVTFTDVIIFAAAKALKKNLIVNTTRKDGFYLNEENVNISLAIDRQGSILTPVIKDADEMSIAQIAKLRINYTEKVSHGKISSEELSGGTFTVSNLGRSVVGHFTPVINYPQSGILGIGRTDDELYLEDGAVKVRKVTFVSLTVDHAIIDGKAAADFLDDFDRELNNL